MNSKIKTPFTDDLFRCILEMKSLDECYQLFEDLCTVHEIQAISQRLAVARMLLEKRTYIDIAERTGASTATISRMNRSLHYGSDEYKLALNRLSEENEAKD